MPTTAASPQGMYIDGQWCPADSGKTLGIINPATEEVIKEVAHGGRAETRRAIEAAHRAMPAWMKSTAYDRAKVLKKTADLLRTRADAVAHTLTSEQGKPLAEAKGEVLHTADTFEWFAEEGKRVYGEIIPHSTPGKRHFTIKHPVGVVGGIIPWNFPAALVSRKVAPALAAGCTIVVKPAPQTPLTSVHIFECMIEAGLPQGVANLVLGEAEEIGTEFIENPLVRKITFTGSTAVGKKIMRGAADQVKRLSLELGGHAPFIVFPDVDPEVGAKLAVSGKFRNNGQVCVSPSRFYVHEDVKKKFTEAVVDFTKALKQGNGLEPGVEIGPMFEQRFMDNAIGLIEDARKVGAKVLAGGARSKKFERGYFFEPTVLADLPAQARILTDEPFAPVLPLLGFKNLDDVIAAANNTKYGLASYVFTNDLTTAWRMAEGLEAGIIGVNDPVPATPQCPFGGMKESGLGRELAHEGLDAFLETKYVSIKLRDA